MPASYPDGRGNGPRPTETWNSDDPFTAAPLGALRRFTQGRRKSARPPVERCELCGLALGPEHRHLLALTSQALVCACDACAVLFGSPGSAEQKYRLIPRRYLALPDFVMTDEQWDNLMIPVNMAFILHSTGPKPVIAFYPSPAGAMESLLSLQGWEALVASNPVLNDLEPDVEALLINRVRIGGMRHAENSAAAVVGSYYIVPIDACYQLVGIIRTLWRGLSGGEEVWDAIAAFFREIQAKARPQRDIPAG